MAARGRGRPSSYGAAVRRVSLAHRPASWERGRKNVSVSQHERRASQSCVDETSNRRPYTPSRAIGERGDTVCLDRLLGEAAFDVLGAARFLRHHNPTFARQALATALDELTKAATLLGCL